MSLLIEATTKHQSGELAEAAQLYSSFLSQNSKNLEALCLFGLCLHDLGYYPQAEKLFSVAIKYNASRFDLYQNRGITRLQMGKTDEALSDFEGGLSILPNDLDCLLKAGNTCIQLDKIDKALQFFQKAVKIYPTDDGAIAGLACSLSMRGLRAIKEKKIKAAIIDLQKAQKLCPDTWEIAYNLGNAHLKSDNYSMAQLQYEKAKELNGDNVDLHCNLGIALERLGIFSQSIQSYENALNLDPGSHAASYNKSLLLLKLGKYRQGFKLYEHRWETKEFAKIKRTLSAPLWLGREDLKTKTILCHAEQGLGDTIQFLRFCSLFNTKTTKVLVQCHSSLIGVAQSMDIVAEYFEMNAPLPEYDFHCPLMSLPRAFNYCPQQASIRNHYFFACDQKKIMWDHMLGVRNKPRIGLVLEGKESHVHNHFRSIDAASLIDVLPDGIDYFLLQKQLSPTSQALLINRPDVRGLSSQLKDFSDTAAACANMDLIISVDTAVAHLSGALGCPTVVLLHYQSDWRWGLDTPNSHWYSNMNLIRLKRDNQWPSIHHKIKATIDNVYNAFPLS